MATFSNLEIVQIATESGKYIEIKAEALQQLQARDREAKVRLGQLKEGDRMAAEIELRDLLRKQRG